MVTTTASSPRLIHTVQSEITRCVGSKCTTDFSSRRLQIKFVKPKPRRSATNKPTTKTEQRRRQQARCEESEEQLTGDTPRTRSKPQRAAVFEIIRQGDGENRDQRQQHAADEIDAHVLQREKDKHIAADFFQLALELAHLQRTRFESLRQRFHDRFGVAVGLGPHQQENARNQNFEVRDYAGCPSCRRDRRPCWRDSSDNRCAPKRSSGDRRCCAAACRAESRRRRWRESAPAFCSSRRPSSTGSPALKIPKRRHRRRRDDGLAF